MAEVGADTLIGGAGNDTYVVDNVGDVVDEGAGSGTDLVQAAVSFDLSAALGDVENLTLTGAAAVNGTGNGLANTITGNTGANIIEGKGGADILDGGAGLDTVSYASSGAGVTVTLTGAVASFGTGGDAQGDSIKNFENITGSAHADTLTGDGLANIIDGGAGADVMNGGAGNDTYVVDDLLDVITEALTGGTDLVKSSIDYSLLNSQSRKPDPHGPITSMPRAMRWPTSSPAMRATTGWTAAPADTMVGGLGDDTYVVDVATDKVTETLNQGIFITAIWPIIINTAVGIRNIPQDYRNVAAVLRLNPIEFFQDHGAVRGALHLHRPAHRHRPVVARDRRGGNADRRRRHRLLHLGRLELLAHLRNHPRADLRRPGRICARPYRRGLRFIVTRGTAAN